MADSFTGNLNLRLPEVGHATDTWGGTIGLNADLTLLDGLFQKDGLSTVAPVTPHPNASVPGVGLRVGVGYTLNVEGTVLFKDPVDVTKVATLDRSLITTATTRTYYFPDEDGILATRTYLNKMIPTGTVMSGYYGNTPPPGFVFLDGRTIGDATSGATNRANADTQVLFNLMWSFNGAVLPARGASAAADWAAHRQVVLPNHSGRVMAGRDNLSGTGAGALPGFVSPGQIVGEPQHTLLVSEIPLHQHSVSAGQHTGEFGFTGRATHGDGVNVAGIPTSNGSDMGGMAPGGLSHNNIQPTIIVDVVIAL